MHADQVLERLPVAFAATAMLFVGAVGCSKVDNPPANPAQASSSLTENDQLQMPAIDVLSPDALVKTKWALQEWLQKNPDVFVEGMTVSPRMTAFCESYRSILAGDALAESSTFCNFVSSMREALASDRSASQNISREITEVISESETRSIVLARFINRTPVPSSVKLSDDDQKRRQFGREIRYVVEKNSEGWRLTSAYSRDTFSVSMAEIGESTDKLASQGWYKLWEQRPTTRAEDSPFHYTYTPEP